MSIVHREWWLATLGRHLIWAQLRVHEAGTAEVFDSDGNTLSYDCEDSARAALMDAEFVSYDGLDQEDALARGFSLADIAPPQDPRGEVLPDNRLRERMVQTLGERT